MAFLNLWNESDCIAIGYEIRKQHGIRPNVPAVALICRNEAKAREFFQLMRSWMAPPCSTAAVDVLFVKNQPSAEYLLCLGVNWDQFLLRTIGPGAEFDYQPSVTTGTIRKPFPLSHRLDWFKDSSSGKEILVYPVAFAGDEIRHAGERPMNAIGKPMTDVGFVTDAVRFLDSADLAPHTPEYALACASQDPRRGPSHSLLPPQPSPDAVSQQRANQMRRFFAVALARLPYNPSFVRASRALPDCFSAWQIDQAACNLLARSNWPEHGYGQQADMLAIYDNLRHGAEAATDEWMIGFAFDAAKLRRQVTNDLWYLHSALFPDSTADAAEQLRSKGYL